MVTETFTCRDHTREVPAVGGFFAICLDCGHVSMRTGRWSYREALHQLLEKLEHATDGLPAEYETRLHEPSEERLVGMMRERERWLNEMRGAYEALGEAIVELEAKDPYAEGAER